MAGGGPDAPRPLAPNRGAQKHTRRDTGAHLPGCAGIARRAAGWGLGPREWGRGAGRREVSESQAAPQPLPPPPPGPGPGPGRRAGELHAGWVVLCGAAGRLRLPSDLRATAVRAECFVFAAAPLTAAITLTPPRNPRGAERLSKSVASENRTPGLCGELCAGRRHPPRAWCQAGQGKAGWTLGEQLPANMTQ